MFFSPFYNISTGEYCKCTKKVLTYGLNEKEIIVLRAMFYYFEVLDCTDAFTDLLAVPAKIIVFNPQKMTVENINDINAAFENETKVIMCVTNQPEQELNFFYKIIDLSVIDRSILSLQKLIQENNCSCINNCKNLKINGSFILFDIETSSVDAHLGEIIYFHASKITNFEVCDRFEICINPEKPVNDDISELTGITNDMLSRAGSFTDSFNMFLSWAENLPVFIWNLDFVSAFIESAFWRYDFHTDYFTSNGCVDLLALVKTLYGNYRKFNSRFIASKILPDYSPDESIYTLIEKIMIACLKELKFTYDFDELCDINKFYCFIQDDVRD